MSRQAEVPLAVREVLQQLPGVPVSEVRTALHTCAGERSTGAARPVRSGLPETGRRAAEEII